MRRKWVAVGAVVALVGGIYLVNASWLAPLPVGRPGLLAHRGVHQTFHQEGLTNDTCTASRIYPPVNPYLENTIPSMIASFATGATVLELDVHPTTDGEFAVFHDWSLECRTNGHGVTRDQSMAYLKTLDIGYGYTADGGKTFPFRGKGVGLMPTLNEVLTTFPSKQFVINIKSNDPTEADRLVAYLNAHGRPTDGRLWVFADGRSGDRLRQLVPNARVISRKQAKACAFSYLAWGWTGHVPSACRNNFIGVPVDLRWAYWGWPNRFLARMKTSGTLVMIVGQVGRGGWDGISSAAQLQRLPTDFPGIILTDEIEKIGPAVRHRWPPGSTVQKPIN